MKVNTEAYVLLEEQTVLILRMRMIFLNLFLCFILHPLDNPSKENVGIWANDFTSLHLNFLIYEMEIIRVPITQGCFED